MGRSQVNGIGDSSSIEFIPPPRFIFTCDIGMLTDVRFVWVRADIKRQTARSVTLELHNVRSVGEELFFFSTHSAL